MVSIIIPTFNEQEELPETLARLSRNSVPHEVIIVDAGSSDETCAIGQSSGARVVQSACKQRAAQMNLGATLARAGSLLFLHADTWLPERSLAQIETCLESPEYAGGGFARQFRSLSLVLRLTCRLATVRCRALGWFLGDQAIFARSSIFEKLDGYKFLDQFEDLDFCRRMKAYGKLATLIPPVLSSARRFRNGALRRTLKDLRLTTDYLSRGSKK